MKLEQELLFATMNSYLENVDLHGLDRESAIYEVDKIIRENPDSCVRIIYGRGTGVLEREVLQHLQRLKTQKKSPILGMQRDTNTHSVVVRVQ